MVLVANVAPNEPAAGGVRAHTLRLRRSLAERGVRVLLVGKGSTAMPDFLSVVRSPRVGDVRFTLALFRLPPFREAVVHAQYPIYAIPWLLRGHRRVVCVLHGDNIRAITSKRGGFAGRVYGLAEGFALRRCARIVVVSSDVADAYTRLWPELRSSMTVIPLEPDLSLFRFRDCPEGPALSQNANDGPLVLYVGRLRRDKRPDVVLRAFARLNARVPQARLWIYGDGVDRGALESLAASLGLSGSVMFHGSVSQERVSEAMACGDVLALASSYESGPLVVAEARLCGMRVVATRVGRVEEFQTRFGGLEIVESDEAAFADAMERAVRLGRLPPPTDAIRDASLDAFLALYREMSLRGEVSRRG